MRFKKALLSISAKIKPLLIRLLPIEWLRKMKKRLIASSVSEIDRNNYLPFSRGDFPDGVNLIGFIRAEIGLGQSCRLVADALDNSKLPFGIYNYVQVSAMRLSDNRWDHKITNTTPYNINIFHINPYEMPLAYVQLGKEVWDKHYNIGFWLWELEEFPEDWLPALNLVDEVWAPSEFTAKSVRQVTNKPVHTVPYPMSAPICHTYNRSFFELPEDKFLFLCMYDCNSTIERKNPIGVIRAYKKAFPIEKEDCGLVIKVNNPQAKDLNLIKSELVSYSNVWLITDVLSKVEVNSLMACVDTFVSLHRAEGFGLPPAEAMLLGTPVISTNWSSTTEFMTPDTACLVDFTFTTIPQDIGPYKAGNRWADPDIQQTASYMVKLYEDRSFAHDMAEKAQKHIKDQLNISKASDAIDTRISEIYLLGAN